METEQVSKPSKPGKVDLVGLKWRLKEETISLVEARHDHEVEIAGAEKRKAG